MRDIDVSQDLLKYIERDTFYNGSITDQIVLQFVFILLIRQEIFTFVQVHNQYKIRRDRKRLNHVPGQPNALYMNIERDTLVEPLGERTYGFKPASSMLDEMDAMITGFSKSTRFTAFYTASLSHANRILDPNIYITESARIWCQASLAVVGKLDPIVASDFLKQWSKREGVIPDWYRTLIRLAREENGRCLQPVEKPRQGYRWVHRQMVENQLREEHA